MNETERILRIILKIVGGPLTVRELTGYYTLITGTSIPHEDLGYWILTDYLTSIPHILSLERRFNDFDGIVIPNEPEEDNLSETNSFSSYETIPELIRETSLSQDVDNKVDQENNETVEQSHKEDEEQSFNNHSTDPYVIDVKRWDTIASQDYYWENDSSIVKKTNWHLPYDIVDLDSEFFLSHCFWRPVNSDEQIRNKMQILMKRQQKRVEFIQSLEQMHKLQEIMDYSLEDLWQDYNESLIQFEQDPEVVDTPGESDNLSTLAE
ncbi:hypothetical protein WA026_023174 [Henosepilachna vigintioctopunctata]|uniref:Uncharacterized protein n=1 Tax=Henosepilachna vigintioctopunctata TaxID=420089 RepID=A0AAW1US31_9CUCU